jgi:redox-sensitive bicupin YhaK (pirin superfamily)
MIQTRPSAERGSADHGWLQSLFTFSFAGYHDPAHVHFRGLRVLNEDRVAPGQGFGMHPHRDMEILTWVRMGMLEHADTLGNRGAIQPGELQTMSAGSGLLHSESNASTVEPVHFFQVWIYPERRGIAPGYGHKRFEPEGRRDRLQLVASADGSEDSLPIQADARFFVADLGPGKQLSFESKASRGQYLHLASGKLTVNGILLAAGDGASVDSETELKVRAEEESHLLLFDLK